MPAHDDTPALDTSFHDHEMAVHTSEDVRWERWLARVERACRLAGLDVRDAMDGDGAADGYSLDECYDWFLDGVSHHLAAAKVIASIRGRA